MLDLVPRLQRHFDGLQDRLTCFADLAVQCEGWFKAELLTLFRQLRAEGLLQDLDREVRSANQRIDLALRMENLTHWIELKHWLIGPQRSVTYDPGFYFNDPTSVGIIGDVRKLSTLSSPARRWMLLLLTANPTRQSWEEGVQRFNRKFAPHQLVPRTDPEQFPSTYFLGLLELGGPSMQHLGDMQL